MLCVARCALRVACSSALRVPARCMFQRVALFFYFAKRKKSSAAKEEAAQKETERCNSRLVVRGKTALHLASYLCNFEMCKLLVESQADVNAKDSRCDARPLHLLLKTRAGFPVYCFWTL